MDGYAPCEMHCSPRCLCDYRHRPYEKQAHMMTDVDFGQVTMNVYLGSTNSSKGWRPEEHYVTGSKPDPRDADIHEEVISSVMYKILHGE